MHTSDFSQGLTVKGQLKLAVSLSLFKVASNQSLKKDELRTLEGPKASQPPLFKISTPGSVQPCRQEGRPQEARAAGLVLILSPASRDLLMNKH